MDFQIWYNQIPFVTKHYMMLIFLTTASISFNIIKYHYLLLFLDSIIYDYQIWRFVTNFFVVGKFSSSFLFSLIMAYFSVSKLEKLFQPNKYAEFFYLILFNSVFLTIFGLIFQIYALSNSLLFSFLYIWCKRVPFEKVQFFFGFLVTSAYLPWVLLGFNIITGGNIFDDLIGLAAGHLYIVLKDILPNSHGYNFLKTPKFFEKLVNKFFYKRGYRLTADVGNNDNIPAPGQGGFEAFGGRGVRLG